MDCTIRVWRALTGVALAVCDTGLTVHCVLLADNKQTIVALGGDVVAPKLIMLNVTRTRHADLRPKLSHRTTSNWSNQGLNVSVSRSSDNYSSCWRTCYRILHSLANQFSCFLPIFFLLLSTNATPIWDDLSDIKSAVILCMHLFGYRYVGDSDTNWRESLCDGRSVSGHKVSNFDRKYLENDKSQRYI